MVPETVLMLSSNSLLHYSFLFSPYSIISQSYIWRTPCADKMPPRAAMNQEAVKGRLITYARRNQKLVYRDIAWCQVFCPDLLAKCELKPLMDQQLSIVEVLCKDEGGINADTLPPIDKHIIAEDDGTFAIRGESARPISTKRTNTGSTRKKGSLAAIVDCEN